MVNDGYRDKVADNNSDKVEQTITLGFRQVQWPLRQLILISRLGDALKSIYRDAKHSVIPPNPLKKGETEFKVLLFKGDLGESNLLLIMTRLLKHPLRPQIVINC